MAGWHASTGRATNRENREQMEGHAISIQFANQRRRMHVSSSFMRKWSKRHDVMIVGDGIGRLRVSPAFHNLQLEEENCNLRTAAIDY
jgi:hypothetical protein